MHRRHVFHYLLALALLVVALSAVSLHAQERNVALPPLVAAKSQRIQTLWILNGQPVRVTRTDFESSDRAYTVVHELATVSVLGQDLVAGRVREFVTYDGARYTRMDATSWKKTTIPNYKPGRSLIEVAGLLTLSGEAAGVLSRLDPMTLGNTPVAHYQYWVTDPAWNTREGGQATEDLFVSGDNHLLGFGYNIHGDKEFSLLVMASDFDAPIVVGMPPADQIK